MKIIQSLKNTPCLVASGLFFISVVIFLLWPTIDTSVSNLFYDGERFYLRKNVMVLALYWLFAKIQIVYLLIMLIAITLCTVKKKPYWRKRWVYLLACLLLGPGLLVNTILKDNSLGRPRPIHNDVFGGQHRFVPVFHYSGICQKNCSFVSGHASIGFYTMALAWFAGRKRWVFIGAAMGLAVGFVRIIQGGHYLSDVVFAGWITLSLYWGLARAFGLSWRLDSQA